MLNARKLGYLLAIGAALSFASRDGISRHVLVAPPMVTAPFALTIGGIMLFASGGILYLIFQDIAPQSRLDRHWGPPLGAVLGFCITLFSHYLVI